MVEFQEGIKGLWIRFQIATNKSTKHTVTVRNGIILSHGFNCNIRIANQDVQYGGIPLPHTFKIN